MNKKATALALAVAGFAAQDASAIVSVAQVSAGAAIFIGCTAPGPSGATVYSIDSQMVNVVGNADTVALPTGVSVGASCSYAVGQLSAVSNLTGTGTGVWQGTGATGTIPAGATPVNVTVPGTGYSLQQYTFVAQ